MAWVFYRVDTIDHTQVTASSAAFMRLQFLGGSFAATVANGGRLTNANGYDLIFSSTLPSTSITPLPFELVPGSYDATTGAGIWYVRIPFPSTSVDTPVYVVYQNSAITTNQSSVTTWENLSTQDWDAVIHFNSGTVQNDSTVNAFNLNDGSGGSVGTPAYTTGPWTGSKAFDGNGSNGIFRNSVPWAPVSPPYTGAVTISVWLKFPSPSSGDNEFVGIGGNGGTNPRFAIDYVKSSHILEVETGSGGPSLSLTNDSDWHQVVMTIGSGAAVSTAKIYLDGALQSATGGNGSGLLIPSTGSNFTVNCIPGATGSGAYGTGSISEYRVSLTQVDAGSIATDWQNSKQSSTFAMLGPELRIGVFATLVIDDGPGLADRSNYIAVGQHKALSFNLTAKQRGTASIALEIPASDTYTPTTGSLLFLSDLNVPVCVFAGSIDSWEVDYFSNEGDRFVTLTCTDLMQTLDTVLIPPRTYFNQTAGAIVTDIYNTVLSPLIPFNLGTISPGATIPGAYSLSWDKVSDIFTQLANASEFAWGIDYSASIGGAVPPTLYFQTPGTVGSPLTLVTGMILWESAKYTQNRANFINREIVRISYSAFTPLTNFDPTPDGILTSFTLPYPVYQVIAAGTSTATQSTQTGTFTGVPANNDTVTIDGRVYTWKTTLDNTQKDQIHIGATANACATNLADAINATPATAGKGFSFPTWYHFTCSASATSGTVTINVMIAGAGGNGTALSESTSNFTWASGSTAGGVDGITQALNPGVSGSGTKSDLEFTVGSQTITTSTAPASGTALLIAYQRYGADCIVCEDTASVATRAAAEGGTGLYEQLSSDTSETNPDTALQAAQAVLTAYDVIPASLQFQTDTAGWVLGQEVTTALTGMGTLSTLVTGNWLIQIVAGDLIIEDDPTKMYLPFRYTITLVDTSTIAAYVQFFQLLNTKPPTTPGPVNPTGGAGAGQSGTQFETFILSANGTVASAGVLNSQGVTLIVTATQDGTGGWNFAFDPGSFSADPAHVVNPAANSSTQWTFLGNGTIFVEQAYMQL